MQTTKEDLLLIDRYHNYDLDEGELKDFLGRLENEEGFSEKVDRLKNFHQVVDALSGGETANAQQEAKESWNNFLEEENKAVVETPKAKSRNIKRYLLTMAACVALLLAVTAIVQNMESSNPQELAIEYWEATKRSTSTITKGDQTQEGFAEKMNETDASFMAGDYEKSLQQLAAIPSTYDDYARVLLLKGQNSFGLKEYQKASNYYQELFDLNKDYTDLAKWYQALAFIKLNKIEVAKSNLEFIIKEKYPIQNQAKKLLNDL